jgi:penicillin-binding protein 1C
MKKQIPGRIVKILAALALLLVLVRFFPHEPLSRRIPLSTAVWSSDGELLRVTLASDDQYRLWTPLSQLIEAFLLKEDRWFYWHPGINPVSIVRAGFRTWRGPGRAGGSTLTMQVARMIYRLNTRTPAGKLRQIGAALWLEARYSKRELIEAYLNLAPFGSNIEGVGAASRIYYGKSPEHVTLAEALTLAVIPQHPATRAGRADSTDTINDSPEIGMLAARSQLGALWLKSHASSEGFERQLDLEIVARRQFAMPQQAPHFVDKRNDSGCRAAKTGGTPDSALHQSVRRSRNSQCRGASGGLTRYVGEGLGGLCGF